MSITEYKIKVKKVQLKFLLGVFEDIEKEFTGTEKLCFNGT
mgnify:CR=1 FL=1